MRVALGQISSTADPGTNLLLVEKEIARAAAARARLLVLPEATMCRFGVPLRGVAEPLEGPWATRVLGLAAEAGLTVVAGMFTPAADGRVHNTVIVAGPGGLLGHYDKIHLYDAFGHRESDTVAPGTEPLTVNVDGVRIGVATCYDIRFPGLFTELASRGALVTVVPASWGAGPGKLDQWTLLARARALDSTSFVVGCGQAGPGGTGPAGAASGAAPTGVGGSLVASPLGEVRARLGAAPDFTSVDLDLREVSRARETVPVLAG
ncbi:carbon-nitrogen hydrolase family protein [Streptomyces sp. NBC_00847]|uniref:carbon-nitrogen hydrolase family protein n=1 Tax=unclassified Streptomyces TaxID=2593676 RepID=UPI00224CAAB7|nr:carbon-nitrogen hydrolase family protein [Streptomyces sp. NBC_00847]MCX4882335.1 carbon-nitrogen hydrolase family protein [Streptomyces sp. NBC_00847]